MDGKNGGRNSRSKSNSTSSMKDIVEDDDKKYNCPICDKPETTLECEICVYWYHPNCANVSSEKFKLLQENDVHWYCKNCDFAAKQLHRKVTTLQAETTKLKNDMKKLTTKLNKVEANQDALKNDCNKTITEKIGEECNKIKGAMTSELTNLVLSETNRLKPEIDLKIKDTFIKEKNKLKEELKTEILGEIAQNPATLENATATREIVRDEIQQQAPTRVAAPTRELVREEMEERERIHQRKNNLIILRLEEAATRTDGQGEQEDLRAINEIIKDKLNLDITVSNASRLGTYSRDKQRPVRVVVDSIDNKKKILSRAVRLREVDDSDKYARVYIRPDLTKAQLEVSKNLYGELLKKREQQPLKRWKIVRGVVVEVIARGVVVEA